MKNSQEKRMMSNWLARTLALAMLATAALSASAQNAIQSITSTQQAGAEVVRVEFAEPLAAEPKGFAIQTPPRIAIDLPGIGNAMGKNSVEINQGNLRSANVALAGDRARLVLNLKAPSTYRTQLQGKALLVVLETGAPAPLPEASGGQPVHFAESLNRTELPLKNIDFRRGQDGAGRVVVDLANNQIGVDIKQQGQSLVVEFLRSTLPEALRRRLDVTDFGTPVTTISSFQQGDRVRVVVEPRGAWEHSAYQTDNQFVLEVRPQKVDPSKLTQGPGYAGEKLSLNFQNIEVRALLQVIADFTNFNIVTSDTVAGNVTLRLKDVPWDQALDIILETKGLGLKKTGNVILIAPKEELAARRKATLASEQEVLTLEPLRTQSFQLNYARAEDVMKQIVANQASANQQSGGGGASNRMLSPRGSINFDIRTNQVFITDIPSKLAEAAEVIAKIDIPVRQVLIEARIVIADDTFGRSLGVRLGFADLSIKNGQAPGISLGNSGDTRATVGGNLAAVGGQTGQIPGPAFSDTSFINLPAPGKNDYNAATFALSLFGINAARFLNLELSALEADGKGKVVSSPRVVTSDQVKALIEQGEELPYQVATSSGATALTFRKATLKLEVTPQITPEGNVILDVDVNKDSVGRATANGLAIDTKHVRTQVLVENGGTVVIGGIFEQVDRTDVTKVPFLGDIPYLGNLFKTTTRNSDKKELLIFITPKVISERAPR
ncbi:MAG: type IV pilus secretin PilQ [Piscinibacter sp.]|nr:type IV pilus secretin PilQ [Piscinibacter sp.]